MATVTQLAEHPLVMTVEKAESGEQQVAGPKRVYHVPLEFEFVAEELPAGNGDTSRTLADAQFIIDVGYALRNRENFDLVVAPLKKRLEEMGVKNVMVGGTRKVVEELKLLAPDQQIGQTGTSSAASTASSAIRAAMAGAVDTSSSRGSRM